MTWSRRCCEGFALAATIAADRGGAAASAGLAEPARTQLRQLACELAELPKAERRARVQRMTAAAPLARNQAGRNARALSLLMARASAEQARGWAQAASLPRPGFAIEPALLALLRRRAESEPRP